MKILKVNEWCQHINEMATVRRTAQQVDDFFDMLDPKRKAKAFVYYAKSMDGDLAKTTNGKRMPNPMLGRFFKTVTYCFDFGRTYMEEMERLNPGYGLNPDAPINQEKPRSSGFFPVEGYKFIKQNKNGELCLPIINPQVYGKAVYYMIADDGELVECDRDDIVPYMTPSKANPKPYTPSSQFNRVDMRSLYVDKIYMLNADKKTWTNTNGFLYPILAGKPFNK